MTNQPMVIIDSRRPHRHLGYDTSSKDIHPGSLKRSLLQQQYQPMPITSVRRSKRQIMQICRSCERFSISDDKITDSENDQCVIK